MIVLESTDEQWTLHSLHSIWSHSKTCHFLCTSDTHVNKSAREIRHTALRRVASRRPFNLIRQNSAHYELFNQSDNEWNEEESCAFHMIAGSHCSERDEQQSGFLTREESESACAWELERSHRVWRAIIKDKREVKEKQKTMWSSIKHRWKETHCSFFLARYCILFVPLFGANQSRGCD